MIRKALAILVVLPLLAGLISVAPAQEFKEVEKERAEFKHFIAVNPNYFGTFPESSFEPVKKIVGNTKYEKLTCVGFNARLDLLEATVQVKLPFGYGGSLCGPGTTEYVRFFLDYGGGWENAGLVAFNVHDIPNAADCAGKLNKPLSYVVSLRIEPRRNYCGKPVLPKVRAILAWQQVPPDNNPNWPMVWGNVLERHIQIKPRFWYLVDLVKVMSLKLQKKVELPPEFDAVKLEPIPQPDPPPLTLADLVKLPGYGPQKAIPAEIGREVKRAPAVEPHRFGFSDLHAALDPGSLNAEMVEAKILEWKELGLNWVGAIEALAKTSGNVSYEQLDCLGLDYNREWLVATFHIKRPYGYSGNLCQKGSLEHVAFWADWNDKCQWTYLGTVQVRVHDIAKIPPGGLHYAAILKVNLDPYRRSCHRPKVGRVRAVLSWNTPPSTVNPGAIPYWGNRKDTHVQIKPGKPTDGPRISILGGIGLADINVFGNGMTKPNARFALHGTYADPWNHSRQCPFGGRVMVQGPPLSGYRYRALVLKVGTTTQIPVTNSIWTVNQFGVGTWRYPDSQGFLDYLPWQQNMNDVLARWQTSGDDLWLIRLQQADGANNVINSTPWYRCRLDNTAPDAEISITGGECKTYAPGVKIKGHFVARDAHFGRFVLDTLPDTVSGTPVPNPTTATANTSQTAVAPGDPWELNTSTMKPCGYVIQVRVWDRSIRNSHPGGHNYNDDEKGFCLIEE